MFFKQKKIINLYGIAEKKGGIKSLRDSGMKRQGDIVARFFEQ
jgi:hypothetical protein